MKKLLFLILILYGCGPYDSQMAFEEDYCGWTVTDKHDFPDNRLVLEKERERKSIDVLRNFYDKYQLGDTICVSQHLK